MYLYNNQYGVTTIMNSQQTKSRRSQSEGVEVGEESAVVGADLLFVVVFSVVEVWNHDRLQPLEDVYLCAVLNKLSIKFSSCSVF